MEETELIFNFFYILLCFCLVYPPEEFISLGFTIENCFSKFLGSKDVEFVRYHQKRTALNLFIHSCLPAFYFLIYQLKFAIEDAESDSIIDSKNRIAVDGPWALKCITWKVAQRFSILAVLCVPALIFYWMQNNWEKHPISRTLKKYSNTRNSYVTVASDINNECRRQDVFFLKMNSISAILATENWIIKTMPYNVYFAHQSDTTVSVDKSEIYNIAQDTSDALQILSINIRPDRAGVEEFQIRINALEFRTLEDRINRPIIIPSDIQFHRNLIDRFIEVFKNQVSLNPIYQADQVNDKCFACMIAEPNIKIHKQCLDETPDGRIISEENRCTNCYCRPMWCVECLARWFAARQNEFDRDVWLEKKCTCPMCRAPFCLLDVSYIQRRNS